MYFLVHLSVWSQKFNFSFLFRFPSSTSNNPTTPKTVATRNSNQSLTSLDIGDTTDLDSSGAEGPGGGGGAGGESEIFDFENCDAVSLGGGGVSTGGVASKHKFDADTISSVVQNLMIGGGGRSGEDMVDVHYPVCFGSQPEHGVGEVEPRRENSIVQVIFLL